MDIFGIINKKNTLSYEEFVKYCFYELKRFNFVLCKPNFTGRLSDIIYDIEPANHEQWEIFKKISIEHFKKDYNYKESDIYFTNAVSIGDNKWAYFYFTFETLKEWYERDLQREFAVKEEVIKRYKRDYIDHCKKTFVYTDLVSGADPFEAEFSLSNIFSDYNTIKEVYTFKELIKFDKFLDNELELAILQIEEPQPIEEKSNSIHQPHDPNLWNKEAYELFKYLYDYYYLDGRSTNVKLASIWHYFNDYKHLDRIKEPKYILHATKDQYTEFIKSYEIKLTNMDKRNSYYNTHKSTIDGHLENYEKGLLELQNT